MEAINLFDSIIEYLIISSVMLFILGILSSIAFHVMSIQGKPKLWICTLLIIMPLVYPIKVFLPEPITVPVPQKIYQSITFQPVNMITGENHIPGVVAILDNGVMSPDDTITVTEKIL